MEKFEPEIISLSEIVPQPNSVYVIIDVIRAFTTASVAFEHGVTEILLTESPEDAFKLRQRFPDLALVGEVEGRKIEGFDFGNSPLEICSGSLRGKRLAMRTTNGVRGCLKTRNHGKTFAASFRNAKATVQELRKIDGAHYARLIFVPTDSTSDEDYACAEYMKALWVDSNADAKPFHERILKSRNAQKFFDADKSEFNPGDIDFCAFETFPSPVIQLREGNFPTLIRTD